MLSHYLEDTHPYRPGKQQIPPIAVTQIRKIAFKPDAAQFHFKCPVPLKDQIVAKLTRGFKKELSPSVSELTDWCTRVVVGCRPQQEQSWASDGGCCGAPWNLKFSCYIFSKKDCSLCFKWVKWYFTIVARPGKNLWPPLEISTIVPPGKNLSDAHGWLTC